MAPLYWIHIFFINSFQLWLFSPSGFACECGIWHQSFSSKLNSWNLFGTWSTGLFDNIDQIMSLFVQYGPAAFFLTQIQVQVLTVGPGDPVGPYHWLFHGYPPLFSSSSAPPASLHPIASTPSFQGWPRSPWVFGLLSHPAPPSRSAHISPPHLLSSVQTLVSQNNFNKAVMSSFMFHFSLLSFTS